MQQVLSPDTIPIDFTVRRYMKLQVYTYSMMQARKETKKLECV